MKVVNVATLKANLSRYLRAAHDGERVLVLDRKHPLAEIHAAPVASTDPWQRLAAEGRLRLGTQDWAGLKFSKLRKPVSALDLLNAQREEQR